MQERKEGGLANVQAFVPSSESAGPKPKPTDAPKAGAKRPAAKGSSAKPPAAPRPTPGKKAGRKPVARAAPKPVPVADEAGAVAIRPSEASPAQPTFYQWLALAAGAVGPG